MPSHELELLDWLMRRVSAHPALRLGMGDDMAVIDTGRERMLLASDMLLDGVHFDSGTQPLDKIGRKAVACNLSDCAAMAVKPIAVTVSIALHREMSASQAQAIFAGIFGILREYHVALAGGDTTSWPHPLALDVSILAMPFEGIEPVSRKGARIGDLVYVTGPLGGSILGRHLDFQPRIKEARALAERLGERLHAMMDISDGLSLDFWRLCQASRIGGLLDENLIQRVVSADAHSLAKSDGVSPIQHALADGEDFELLLAVDGDVSSSPVPLFPVGEITEAGFAWRRTDGRVETLTPTGYLH